MPLYGEKEGVAAAWLELDILVQSGTHTSLHWCPVQLRPHPLNLALATREGCNQKTTTSKTDLERGRGMEKEVVHKSEVNRKMAKKAPQANPKGRVCAPLVSTLGNTSHTVAQACI